MQLCDALMSQTLSRGRFCHCIANGYFKCVWPVAAVLQCCYASADISLHESSGPGKVAYFRLHIPSSHPFLLTQLISFLSHIFFLPLSPLTPLCMPPPPPPSTQWIHDKIETLQAILLLKLHTNSCCHAACL